MPANTVLANSATALLDPMSAAPVAPSLAAAQRRSAQLEAAIQTDPGRFRVLTGDRPTGPLHIGHLFGTLLNRVRLQRLGVDVMVLVADYQTITDRDSPDTLPADVLGLIADYHIPRCGSRTARRRTTQSARGRPQLRVAQLARKLDEARDIDEEVNVAHDLLRLDTKAARDAIAKYACGPPAPSTASTAYS